MKDEISVPIIVRLEGTNSKIAKEIIDSSGLNFHSAVEFKEAADKVQKVFLVPGLCFVLGIFFYHLYIC